MRAYRLSFAAATFAACVSLAACAGDSTAPRGARPVSVSFSASSATATSAVFSRAATSVSGAAVLVISSAELVLARVELSRVGVTCAGTEPAGDDAPGADDGCAELELAPRVVSVPVDGAVTSALTVDVPAGRYSALEAKIRAVDTKSGGERRAGSAAFLAAHPDLAGVSVRVRGTFNGTAFTYVGAPQAELESAFSPALVVDTAGASANVTIGVDLTSWFRASNGALIDPATANAGGANAGVVADNVKRSFHAFRDDDRNGHDDHDGR